MLGIDLYSKNAHNQTLFKIFNEIGMIEFLQDFWGENFQIWYVNSLPVSDAENLLTFVHGRAKIRVGL